MRPQKKQLKTRKQKKSLTELSPTKMWIFRLAAVLIPILILILLEITLRILQYGGNLSLFVPTPNPDSDYYGINREVGRRYFYVESFVPSPRKDLFLKGCL